ncbi:MAG TPA: GNAT family N-acetyltransferase [Actinomycetes bacterium]|jgi:predicted GNAT superfamily acetyltransferase|nr:GNAT family N-acetyltransferase [Actinomycetes bacterium]
MTTPAPAPTGQVEPRRTAEAAARAAGVVVVELGGVAETAAVSAVFGAIWGVSSPAAMPAELVRALAHAGNYVAGAYDGEELVGAVVGFLGLHHGRVHLHSHVAGVVPRAQGRSVGLALKLHQRAWALARGIGQAEWTYDPLVRRNAYFNLTKLGATAVAYHTDFYGGMDDAINAGEPTDRCVALWDLAAPRVVAAAAGAATARTAAAGAAAAATTGAAAARAAAAGAVPEPDRDALLAGGAAVLLAEGGEGEPLASPGLAARVLLCQVPEDVVALRTTQPELARAWRLAVRETLGRALAAGWVATAASRSGWCVLEREEGRR